MKWQCRPRGMGENSSFPEHPLHGACSFLGRSQGYSSVNRLSGPHSDLSLVAEAEGENLNCCCRFGVCQIIVLLEADQLVADSVLLYCCPNSEGSFSLCILTVAIHSGTTDSSSFLIPNCFGSPALQ